MISFEYAAAADSTPIKIKNNNIGDVRHANKNKGYFFNTSLGTIITIYGDITKFLLQKQRSKHYRYRYQS